MSEQSTAFTLQKQYDFIVCGAGSSGSVIARRLAESGAAEVLLLEAGGTDDVPNIKDPTAWPKLRGSAQDWGFAADKNPHLNDRSIPMAMGKVLGGGSSINVMVWSRGHKADWDFVAAAVDDEAWNNKAMTEIYKRIEDWHGPADPTRRGQGGPMFVDAAKPVSALTSAAIDAFTAAGLTAFDDANGVMMEGDGGVAPTNICVKDDERFSAYRGYIKPIAGQKNLTIVTGATITRVILEGTRAEGVEFSRGNAIHRVTARHEVILSLGAINTPKTLMLSGVGNVDDLAAVKIPVVHALSGVGRNFQDHFMAPCVWQSPVPIERRLNLTEATAVWKNDASSDRPDFQAFLITNGYASPMAHPIPLPENCWSLTTAVLRTDSPGRLKLRSADFRDPIGIDANFLVSADDRRRLRDCIDFCRTVGNSAPMTPFRKAEILPASDNTAIIDTFMRNGTVSHSHQTCTAKMGRDEDSVVDGQLRVHGIEKLRIADGSVFPRVPTGNTMAPCIAVGERAADIIRSTYGV